MLTRSPTRLQIDFGSTFVDSVGQCSEIHPGYWLVVVEVDDDDTKDDDSVGICDSWVTEASFGCDEPCIGMLVVVDVFGGVVISEDDIVVVLLLLVFFFLIGCLEVDVLVVVRGDDSFSGVLVLVRNVDSVISAMVMLFLAKKV